MRWGRVVMWLIDGDTMNPVPRLRRAVSCAHRVCVSVGSGSGTLSVEAVVSCGCLAGNAVDVWGQGSTGTSSRLLFPRSPPLCQNELQ